MKRLLLASISLYLVMFIIFYPPFYTTLDEANYIRGSNHIREGHITITDPLTRYGFISNGKDYVPISYGMPIFLTPFVLFGWKAAFVSGLLVHILGTIIFYKLLMRFNLRTDNVLLYLFFPYFIYYSSTLYPDFPSALFVLIGFYFYTSTKSRDHTLSGAAFGIACLIKITNVLAFIPFILLPFLKDRIKFWRAIFGFTPFLLLILLLNNAYYGGMFKMGYWLVFQEYTHRTFSFSYQYYIPFIAFRLLVIFPFMLLAPLFYRGKGRAEILGALLLFFAFFGIKDQSGWGFNLDPSTLTRYFLPIMPLLLLTYIPFYENIIERLKIPRKVALSGAVLILIAGGLFILNVQQERLGIQASVSEAIYENTEPGALLISEQDVIRYLLESFGDRRFLESATPDVYTYLDDKTYIIRKRFEGPSPYEQEQAKLTEEIIDKSKAELIKEIEYRTETRFFASRPFTLEIYKVPLT